MLYFLAGLAIGFFVGSIVGTVGLALFVAGRSSTDDFELPEDY